MTGAKKDAVASNVRREIVPMVVDDLAERVDAGVRTYGSPLAVESGNDALQFAYEEALDLAIYLRQMLAQRATES